MSDESIINTPSKMKLIVGNWKMYPRTFAEAKRITITVKKNIGKLSHARVVICPPAFFIAPLLALLKKGTIVIGAQNSAVFDEGAYTGELSPLALSQLGTTHVILGHSERRAIGEDDATIAKKAARAVRSKLKVILCVGERVRDEAGSYFTEVGRQLRSSLEGFPKNEAKRLIIAYEPVWAIGAKALRAANPEDFREMSVFIRRNLVDRFGKKAGFVIPILYGGSVDEHNAERFLFEAGANGCLVGRASLNPKKFSAIIKVAERVH